MTTTPKRPPGRPRGSGIYSAIIPMCRVTPEQRATWFAMGGTEGFRAWLDKAALRLRVLQERRKAAGAAPGPADR